VEFRRATSLFVSFEIGDFNRGRFAGPRTRVVKEQQQRVISLALSGVLVGCRKQSIHLRLFQIGERVLSGAFEWNAPDFTAPRQVFGTALADEPRQSVQGGETLVSSDNAATTFFLDILEENAHSVSGHIFDFQSIDVLSGMGGEMRKEQPQRIAVALLSVASEISFCDQVFQQELFDPRAEQGVVLHRPPPGLA
jgi:hypothetical protein